MHRRVVELALLCLCAGQVGWAQELKILDHTVQIHGFASQGFVHTDHNNWLTMYTSHVGSGEYTDFAANASTQISDHLRVGAQIYDRNLGKLGRWHPSLDWAFADYRYKPWLGIRAGKVETVLGLYNDTQDLDFVRTFALLPQSVYPTDVRDATNAHAGGDLYGSISLKRHLGTLSYTAYAGHRSDSSHSGYPYLLSQWGTKFQNFGALQYGGDLRWKTPIRGVLIGASRLNQNTEGSGTSVNPGNRSGGRIPYYECSKADWMNQFYGQYSFSKLRIDSEYRRYLRNQSIFGGASVNITDVRGWYVSGTYRVAKRLELGSYYSRYTITSVVGGALLDLGIPQRTDTNLPENHIYDKVVAARIDLNQFWNVHVEGHFMDGYGSGNYPNGFYPQVNPDGFQPTTNALVLKTSLSF
ncbi:MAG TPA: hypothetical protein VFO46_05050 [Candidatus Sulfotelmatobacter sp.]|nr:hypothetical protein [Candidatus Sulfotelmatobacter sp.]